MQLPFAKGQAAEPGLTRLLLAAIDYTPMGLHVHEYAYTAVMLHARAPLAPR